MINFTQPLTLPSHARLMALGLAATVIGSLLADCFDTGTALGVAGGGAGIAALLRPNGMEAYLQGLWFLFLRAVTPIFGAAASAEFSVPEVWLSLALSLGVSAVFLFLVPAIRSRRAVAATPVGLAG